MRTPSHTVRAPAGHRAVACVASPVVGYFVARLALHWTSLPSPITYAVCLGVAVVVAYRAWSARVTLGGDELHIVNTLASTSVDRRDVRRVTDVGRVEQRTEGSRALRLPAEALRRPWWSLGVGARAYELNREQVRSWLRVPPAERRALDHLEPESPAS